MIARLYYSDYYSRGGAVALVSCKECGKSVSDKALTCPHCGITTPGVSYEEERLEQEIERAEREESDYADRYRRLGSGNFIDRLFNRSQINKFVDLANEAQSRKRELQEQLFALRQASRK